MGFVRLGAPYSTTKDTKFTKEDAGVSRDADLRSEALNLVFLVVKTAVGVKPPQTRLPTSPATISTTLIDDTKPTTSPTVRIRPTGSLDREAMPIMPMKKATASTIRAPPAPMNRQFF
jgi:hypothetical protein